MTLVEILVAMTIGVTMIGMAMVTSVELYKNLGAAETYSLMHDEARQAVAFMSRDIRCGISVSTTNATHLTLSSIGLTGTTNTVEYLLQTNINTPTIKNLIRVENGGGTNVLTAHATSIDFEYWSNPGNKATTPTSTFEVRASLTITNEGSFRISTDLLQTRVLLRNKHY